MRRTLALLCLACFAHTVLAQVELVDAFPDLPAFDLPVNLQHAPGDSLRLYVLEREGLLLSFDNDPAVRGAEVFLDLRSLVRSRDIEEGLLGLAFHPDYAENGHFFVYYTAPNPLRSVLARFTRSATDPRQADPASRLVVLEVPKSNATHNGGCLAFGPDGYLYVSLGDGHCCGDPDEVGQDPTTLFAALLRLDVDHPSDTRAYGIPPDNPFVGNDAGFREEIYAYGLRNPWRFAFDAETGALWLADVGEGTFEEINRIEPGGNYGWDVVEGIRCHEPAENCDRAGLIDPAWVYFHGPHGSVTGGYVYRGAEIPELVGKYVFGDYVSGQLWALTYDDASATATGEELLATDTRIASFGEDAAGELYVVSYREGRLYRISRATNVALEGDVPAPRMRLDLAGPNPARGRTRFVFETARTERVRLAVYDLLGREVAVLFDAIAPAGVPQQVAFEAHALPGGVYFCRMQASRRTQVRKVVVLP